MAQPARGGDPPPPAQLPKGVNPSRITIVVEPKLCQQQLLQPHPTVRRVRVSPACLCALGRMRATALWPEEETLKSWSARGWSPTETESSWEIPPQTSRIRGWDCTLLPADEFLPVVGLLACELPMRREVPKRWPPVSAARPPLLQAPSFGQLRPRLATGLRGREEEARG